MIWAVNLRVGRRERAIDGVRGQGRAFDLDHRHIDRTGDVLALAPDAPAAAIQRNRKAGRRRQIVRIDMQLDHQPVGKVPSRFVDHHMPAGHQKEPCIALEEEAARIGQHALAGQRAHARRSEQDGFDHGHFAASM